MKTGATQEALDEKLKLPNGRVRKNGKICIGPAGENQVLYASVVSNERVAGRGGVGAVMGWMKLKAVCTSGNKEIPVKEKEKMVAHTQKWFKYTGFINNSYPNSKLSQIVWVLYSPFST
jgi:aldehyde:ferredoxin oxidoreductase